MKLSSAANTYVDRAAPWAEAKNGNAARVHKILSRSFACSRRSAVMLWPAMPEEERRDARAARPPAARAAGRHDVWPRSHAADPRRPRARARRAALPDLRRQGAEGAPRPARAEGRGARACSGRACRQAPRRPRTRTRHRAIIAYDDFAKVDLRVGIVKTCEKVPKKDKLLRLTVDLGEPSRARSSPASRSRSRPRRSSEDASSSSRTSRLGEFGGKARVARNAPRERPVRSSAPRDDRRRGRAGLTAEISAPSRSRGSEDYAPQSSCAFARFARRKRTAAA